MGPGYNFVFLSIFPEFVYSPTPVMWFFLIFKCFKFWGGKKGGAISITRGGAILDLSWDLTLVIFPKKHKPPFGLVELFIYGAN